jgi:hypothetical protein
MVSRVIKRHDNAVRLILPAILQGAMGGHAIIADVTVSDDDDPDDTDAAPTVEETIVHGLTHVPKRLPRHLLNALHRRLEQALQSVAVLRQADTSTDASLCGLVFQQYGHHDETYTQFRLRFDPSTVSFRPDIASFEGGVVRNPGWDRRTWTGYVGSKHAHIVELGYTREGFALQKRRDKRAQHALLESLLLALGWRVQYHTVTLGVTGTIYRDAICACAALGVSAPAVTRLMHALVHMSINHTHGLVVQRRKLDACHVNAAFRRPP